MNLSNLTGISTPLRGITVRRGLGPSTGPIDRTTGTHSASLLLKAAGVDVIRITAKKSGAYAGRRGNFVNVLVYYQAGVRYFVRFFDYLGNPLGGLVSTAGTPAGPTTAAGICEKLNGSAAYMADFEFTLINNVTGGDFGFTATTFDASESLLGGRG